MPDEVKWTIFKENQIGDHKLANDEQITNLFLVIFNLRSLLCVNREYAKMIKKHLTLQSL